MLSSFRRFQRFDAVTPFSASPPLRPSFAARCLPRDAFCRHFRRQAPRTAPRLMFQMFRSYAKKPRTPRYLVFFLHAYFMPHAA